MGLAVALNHRQSCFLGGQREFVVFGVFLLPFLNYPQQLSEVCLGHEPARCRLEVALVRRYFEGH